MISIGSKGVVKRDVQDANGMLYKGTSVRIRAQRKELLQVADGAGRVFWIKAIDISV